MSSFSVREELGPRRSTADIITNSLEGYAPTEGEEVQIWDGSTKRFGGLVYSVKKSIAIASGLTTCFISCVDFLRLLDRRVVGEGQSWIDAKVGDVVRDTLTEIDEGIGPTNVIDGPDLDNFTGVYETAAQRIDRACQAGELAYYVDYEKELHTFALASPGSCPFSATGSNIQTLELETTSSDFANRVILILGEQLRDRVEETFDASGRHDEEGVDANFAVDGVRAVFPTLYPIASVPTVKLNGNEKTVAKAETEDTTVDYWWTPGTSEVELVPGGTVPSGADVVSVTYVGTTQSVVAAQNDTSITERQALEGSGSGIYATVREADRALTYEQAQALCDSILDQYDSIPIIARITTKSALEPSCAQASVGQAITINVAEYGTSFDALIRSISIASIGKDYCEYTLECVNGPLVPDAYDFFSGRAAGGGLTSEVPSPEAEAVTTDPPGDITGLTADAVDYTDPNIARITGSATPPVTLNLFDGCETYITVFSGSPVTESDPIPAGHQPYTIASPLVDFTFDFRIPRPVAGETWRIWFVSRSATAANSLVMAEGATQTPYVDVAITARPAAEAPAAPPEPLTVSLTISYPADDTFALEPAWTMPEDTGSTEDYVLEVRYFGDDDCEEVDAESDWIPLGPKGDSTARSSESGPHPIPQSAQWVLARVASRNSANITSDWVETAAGVALSATAPAPNVASVGTEVAAYYETVNGVYHYGFSGTTTMPADVTGLARVEIWAVYSADTTIQTHLWTYFAPFTNNAVLEWQTDSWPRADQPESWDVEWRAINVKGNMTASPTKVWAVEVAPAGQSIQTVVPTAPNVTPVTTGDDACRIYYIQDGAKIKWGFTGAVTWHTSATNYEHSQYLQITALSDQPGSFRILGYLEPQTAGTGDVDQSFYSDPQDLPVIAAETWTLTFKVFNTSGKGSSGAPTVTGLLVDGSINAGGGGGTGSLDTPPVVNAAQIYNSGYHVTNDYFQFNYIVQQPATNLSSWGGFRVVGVRSDAPSIYTDYTGWLKNDGGSSGFYSGIVRIEKDNFPSGAITITVKAVSVNSAGEPGLNTSIDATSFSSGVTFYNQGTGTTDPLPMAAPQGLVDFSAPVQPTVVTIAEVSRTLNTTDNQTYMNISVTPTWGVTTDADRMHWWLSEDAGSSYGYRGFVPGTSAFSFPQLVYVGGKSIKVKIVAGRPTTTPEYTIAVASNTLGTDGHSQTANDIVTNAAIGNISYFPDDQGIEIGRIATITWTNPNYATEPAFFHSQLCVQRGHYSGGTWTPQPTSGADSSYEGELRIVDESTSVGIDMLGAQVVYRGFQFSIPPVSSYYRDLAFFVYTYDRSHVCTGSPATEGILQATAWSGGSFAYFTVGASSASIKATKLSPTTVTTDMIVDASGLRSNITHNVGLANADFVNGLTGWTTTAGTPTVTTTAGEVHTGLNAVKGTGYWGIAQTKSARQNDRFYIEAWMRCLTNTSGAASFNLIIQMLDSAGNSLGYALQEIATGASTSSYTKVSGSGVLSHASTASVRAWLTSNYLYSSDVWVVDDVRLDVQQQQTVRIDSLTTLTTTLGTHLSGSSIVGMASQRTVSGSNTYKLEQYDSASVIKFGSTRLAAGFTPAAVYAQSDSATPDSVAVLPGTIIVSTPSGGYMSVASVNSPASVSVAIVNSPTNAIHLVAASTGSYIAITNNGVTRFL